MTKERFRGSTAPFQTSKKKTKSSCETNATVSKLIFEDKMRWRYLQAWKSSLKLQRSNSIWGSRKLSSYVQVSGMGRLTLVNIGINVVHNFLVLVRTFKITTWLE